MCFVSCEAERGDEKEAEEADGHLEMIRVGTGKTLRKAHEKGLYCGGELPAA